MRGVAMIGAVARQEGNASTGDDSDDDRARGWSERCRYINLYGVAEELVEARSTDDANRTFLSRFHGPDRNVTALPGLPSKSKHSRNTDDRIPDA